MGPMVVGIRSGFKRFTEKWAVEWNLFVFLTYTCFGPSDRDNYIVWILARYFYIYYIFNLFYAR